jgi:hypothetical protein
MIVGLLTALVGSSVVTYYLMIFLPSLASAPVPSQLYGGVVVGLGLYVTGAKMFLAARTRKP